MAQRWWNALFKPVIRLNVPFPWGLKEFGKIYAIAAVYYVAGSVIPLLLLFGIVIGAMQIAPEFVTSRVADSEGHPNSVMVLIATITSFVCGFGAELWYVNSQLRKEGLNIGKVIGLNLDSLNGNWHEAINRSSIAFCIALGAQQALDLLPLPKPHQVTADMASNLTGPSILGFVVLAAIAAPIFEEIIFRGFIFNAFRNIFREGRIFSMVGKNSRFADYSAVILSAAIFAGAHMDMSAFLHLFILGVIMAELYRRSGTLVCPMLLHAFNNILATFLLVSK